MDSKHWKDKFLTHIWIFNVGRGLSVFIRTPLNQGFIYDLGASEEFSPTAFIIKYLLPHLDKYKEHEIAQMIISHPHADHISEIEAVAEENAKLYPTLLTCPHDKEHSDFPDEKINWKRIKNPKGTEKNTDIYKNLYAGKKRQLPLQTIRYDTDRYVPNIEYGIYYVRPPELDELFPKDDQVYGNSMSMVLYYRHGIHSLLIPGDMLPEAFKYLLEEKNGMEKRYTVFDKQESLNHSDWHYTTSNQPSLKSNLQKFGLSVLVAPHHGLKSGYSEALYNGIKNGKPDMVAISEKRHLSETDGEVDKRYQPDVDSSSLAASIEGTTQSCNSVSTRNGQHILIVFEGTRGSPKIFMEKNPEKLLTYM